MWTEGFCAFKPPRENRVARSIDGHAREIGPEIVLIRTCTGGAGPGKGAVGPKLGHEDIRARRREGVLAKTYLADKCSGDGRVACAIECDGFPPVPAPDP